MSRSPQHPRVLPWGAARAVEARLSPHGREGHWNGTPELGVLSSQVGLHLSADFGQTKAGRLRAAGGAHASPQPASEPPRLKAEKHLGQRH